MGPIGVAAPPNAETPPIQRTIAFDVTPELFGGTGAARYSRELGQALERRADCRLVRFAFGRRERAPSHGTRHVRVPLRAVQAAWRAVGAPRAEHVTGAVDIVHSLDLMPPPTRRPLVVTVHDVAALELPSMHDRRRVDAQRRRLAELSRANVVLTGSDATATALVDGGVERNRIHVAPYGLSPFPDAIDPPLPPGRFILAVGTLEPRKGHDLLLRAAAAADLRDHRLVFAGPTIGRDVALRALAGELGIGERLTILGAVSDAVLAGLYRDATLLCMPSFAEGFGFPILEALSFGLPVVGSDILPFREIAGDCAVLVPPGGFEALAQALSRTLSDDALRARLRENGPPRAARFTWDATAKETVTAYELALADGGANA